MTALPMFCYRTEYTDSDTGQRKRVIDIIAENPGDALRAVEDIIAQHLVPPNTRIVSVHTVSIEQRTRKTPAQPRLVGQAAKARMS